LSAPARETSLLNIRSLPLRPDVNRMQMIFGRRAPHKVHEGIKPRDFEHANGEDDDF